MGKVGYFRYTSIHMSTDSRDSLIDKIAEIYRTFQQTLSQISHDHLNASKDLVGKIDTAHQAELRKEIQKQ